MEKPKVLLRSVVFIGILFFYWFANWQANIAFAADTCVFDGPLIAKRPTTLDVTSQDLKFNFSIGLKAASGSCDNWQVSQNVFQASGGNLIFKGHLGNQTITAGSNRLDFFWDARGYQPGTYIMRVSMGQSTVDSNPVGIMTSNQDGKNQVTGQSTNGNQRGSNTDSLPGYDLTIEGIGRIITGIACWTMSTILAVMVIALIIAGVRFYIGGAIGDVASAKKNLSWVLIGITVILGTNVIIATIAYSLGADYRSYIPLNCNRTNFSGTPCQSNDGSDCPNPGQICRKNPGATTGICVQP